MLTATTTTLSWSLNLADVLCLVIHNKRENPSHLTLFPRHKHHRGQQMWTLLEHTRWGVMVVWWPNKTTPMPFRPNSFPLQRTSLGRPKTKHKPRRGLVKKEWKANNVLFTHILKNRNAYEYKKQHYWDANSLQRTAFTKNQVHPDPMVKPETHNAFRRTFTKANHNVATFFIVVPSHRLYGFGWRLCFVSLRVLCRFPQFFFERDFLCKPNRLPNITPAASKVKTQNLQTTQHFFQR